MQLNPECVRDVLVCCEKLLDYQLLENGAMRMQSITWDDIAHEDHIAKQYIFEDTKYTLLQLRKAEMIEASELDKRGDLYTLRIDDITWQGHELLGNIRGESVWQQTLIGAKKLGLTSVRGLWLLSGQIISAAVSNPQLIDVLVGKL